MYTPMLTFKTLFSEARTLKENYQQEREKLDGNRLFSSFRSKTDNPARHGDIAFIKSVSLYIEKNKLEYKKTKQISSEMYDKKTVPLLKDIMCGAWLLGLIGVTATYRSPASVKDGSALGKIILNLFQVNSLEDLPSKYIAKCLGSLKKFIEAVDSYNPSIPIRWHPSVNNEDMCTQITEYYEKFSNTEVESIDFSQSLLIENWRQSP